MDGGAPGQRGRRRWYNTAMAFPSGNQSSPTPRRPEGARALEEGIDPQGAAGAWRALDASANRASERLAGITLCVLVDGGEDARRFGTLVEGLLDAGVRMIQVRDKSLTVPALVGRVRLAVELARRLSGADTLIIVNDRPDVAVAVGAGGVHLGSDDLPLDVVRRVTGPAAVVGCTAHDIGEALAAVRGGADYLGVGPCFPSSTKSFGSHAGKDFLTEVAATIALPAFAIGGVTLDRLDDLRALGWQRVAVAAAITSVADPAAMAALFLERLKPPSPGAGAIPGAHS